MGVEGCSSYDCCHPETRDLPMPDAVQSTTLIAQTAQTAATPIDIGPRATPLSGRMRDGIQKMRSSHLEQCQTLPFLSYQ